MSGQRSTQPANDDATGGDRTLQALQLIETLADEEPFTIVPVSYRQGTVSSKKEHIAAKVRWAQRAGYRVLPVEVPRRFKPYNAVIRVSELGTEDRMRDYLAHLAAPPPAKAERRPRPLGSGFTREY